MDDAASALEPLNPDKPSSARIYDYYLGGAHNFAADRRVAEQISAVYPDVSVIAQVNRAVLRRAVQYLADAGVRQFLDIGSGIPTVGHVHEIAQRTAPDAKVVYVDIDPVAVAHSRDILRGNAHATAIRQDLRKPDEIATHPEVVRLFDFDEPIAVLLVSMLHFVPDSADPLAIIRRLLAPLTSGSFLAISHGTADGPLDMTASIEIYRRSGIELAFRTHTEVEALFADCELLPPGVVWAPLWHPESTADSQHSTPENSANYAGVGRKR